MNFILRTMINYLVVSHNMSRPIYYKRNHCTLKNKIQVFTVNTVSTNFLKYNVSKRSRIFMIRFEKMATFPQIIDYFYFKMC